MKLLVMDMKDDDGVGINLCVRAQTYGHEVRYWSAREHLGGNGLVPKTKDWEASIVWADLTVLTGNCDYPAALPGYFGKGFPIFGTNPKAAELELDRGLGQDVLQEAGVDILPYTVVDSVADAIKLVIDRGEGFAMKPWGGDADKAMTCICKTPEDAIFTLTKWEKEGLFKGQLMMQDLCEGVEIGISGMFGPGGWSAALEESFEHKKFLTGDLGGNTGEMGTVIRHVTSSRLFDMVLEPLGDYLHVCNFVGDVNVNCIIDRRGKPWPLEWTIRLGWPDFNIRQELISGDPLQWMLDLINGQDSLEISPAIAVGITMVHGDFPHEAAPAKASAGYPIRGLTPQNAPHVHYQQMMFGKTPKIVGGKVKEVETELTAGTYPLVVTGSGRTVVAASRAAYAVADAIRWPSNVMYRVDIGKRLEKDLPEIQKHGFATGMKYG